LRGPVVILGGGAAAAAIGATAAIAVLLLAGLALDVVKLRRVKRAALPLGRLAIRGASLGASRTVATPTAIGYLRPAVLVPVAFRERVDAREWDAVLAHECAHLARRDDWAKAAQSAIVRLAWWMPGLWALGNALERELASDEQAAATLGWRDYAACLLRLASSGGRGLAPAFAARRAHVAIRVERLLRPVERPPWLLRAAGFVTACTVGIASVGAAVLAVPGARVDPAPAPAVASHPHRARRHRIAHRAAPARPVAATMVIARALDARTPPLAAVILALAPRAARSVDLHAPRSRAVPVPRAASGHVEIAFAPLPRRPAGAVAPLRSADMAVPAGGSRPAVPVPAGASSLLAEASGTTPLRPDMTSMPIRAFIDL